VRDHAADLTRNTRNSEHAQTPVQLKMLATECIVVAGSALHHDMNII
jgi:hypothetical protein